MPSTNTTEATSRTRPATEELSFTVWPLRDGGLSAWTYLACCLAISWVAARQLEDPLLGIGVFLALALASWRFWVPTRYLLGPKGVILDNRFYSRRFYWRQFSHAEASSRGISLIRSDTPPTLGVPKRIYVLWTHRRREILDVVRRYLECDTSSSSQIRRAD